MSPLSHRACALYGLMFARSTCSERTPCDTRGCTAAFSEELEIDHDLNVYFSSSSLWSAGAAATSEDEATVGLDQLAWTRTLNTTGCPDHPGDYNGAAVHTDSEATKVLAYPVFAVEPIDLTCWLAPVGVAVNGVRISSMATTAPPAEHAMEMLDGPRWHGCRWSELLL
jgi:hypothetical protein